MDASLSRRGLLSVAALAAAASVTGLPRAAAASGAAPARLRLTLPAPTGPHPVGTVALRLVDRARRDPWVPSRGRRELMVSVRYPARDVRGYPRAPQMAPGEAAAYDLASGLGEDLPPGRVDWAATLSHAHTGAPASGDRLPVVLYSPGAGDPRTLGADLCDELASHGYAVVMVDHTHDAGAVEFPNGRVERTVLFDEYARARKKGPKALVAFLKKVADVRVADARFVLDRLGALPGGLGARLDPCAIGMFGQSAGGFAAAHTLHDDRRVRAALNMDGVMGYTQRDDDPSHPSTVATDGVDRPLLLMGMEGDDHHTVASWGAAWEHSTGWHRDLTLTGAAHASFTDLQYQVPQIVRGLGLDDSVRTKNVGSLDPERSVAA
ncbi:alpha/beta hydrolase family protein [Streptomyces sp. NPDC059070]|uniref:alpha/beta hydrolase family protein n=1 Tax=Streptomyces sp. NPDC059070 TaxID=3346713 RepID=UPI00369AA270